MFTVLVLDYEGHGPEECAAEIEAIETGARVAATRTFEVGGRHDGHPLNRRETDLAREVLELRATLAQARADLATAQERLVEEVEALRGPPPALCRFPTTPGRWLRRAIPDMPCIEVDVFTGGMGGLMYMLPGDSVMRHVIDDGMWEVAP